ncbi:alpha beta hydrolase fold-3 domain protein [Botrytis cinerea]
MALSPVLRILPTIFGTIFISFGLNAILRPFHALTFYQSLSPSHPQTLSDAALVEALMTIYGARDIFMGLAMYAASYYRNYKTLGGIVLAGSGVAFVDGWVCWRAGGGQGDHWGYAPVHAVVGMLLVWGY